MQDPVSFHESAARGIAEKVPFDWTQATRKFEYSFVRKTGLGSLERLLRDRWDLGGNLDFHMRHRKDGKYQRIRICLSRT